MCVFIWKMDGFTVAPRGENVFNSVPLGKRKKHIISL